MNDYANYETWKRNEAQLVRELEWRRVALERKAERASIMHTERLALKAQRDGERAARRAASHEHRVWAHDQRVAEHRARLARREAARTPAPVARVTGGPTADSRETRDASVRRK